MPDRATQQLITGRYRDAFGASLKPCFAAYLSRDGNSGPGAALGYRCADAEPLFLERYLDTPVEVAVTALFGRTFERAQIVEIGNFAAVNAMAMAELWGAAANDLAGISEVAVATLTAPLRRMFARIGLPIACIAPAMRERAGDDADAWGSYYDSDPWVCVGLIAQGQDALAAFLQRRQRREQRACA